jgi:hypothetical protein
MPSNRWSVFRVTSLREDLILRRTPIAVMMTVRSAVSLCTGILIGFVSLFSACNSQTEGTLKSSDETNVIQALERLPLKELIRYHQLIHKIEDGHSPMSLLEADNKFISIRKATIVAGVSLIVSRLFSLFDRSNKKHESAPPIDHMTPQGSNVLPVIAVPPNGKESLGDLYQSSLEGFYPRTGYEESTPECKGILSEYFKACFTSDSATPGSLHINELNFKSFKAELKSELKQKMTAQQINAARGMGIDVSTLFKDRLQSAPLKTNIQSRVHRAGIRNIAPGMAKSLRHAEDLLKEGLAAED